MITLTVNSEIILHDGAQTDPCGLALFSEIFLMRFKFIFSGFIT
jgi:hypothetical protein